MTYLHTAEAARAQAISFGTWPKVVSANHTCQEPVLLPACTSPNATLFISALKFQKVLRPCSDKAAASEFRSVPLRHMTIITGSRHLGQQKKRAAERRGQTPSQYT